MAPPTNSTHPLSTPPQMPEEDAFCVFVSLMKDYRLRELYKPSMADLGLCFHLLERSMEELFPNLYLHFRAVVRTLASYECVLTLYRLSPHALLTLHTACCLVWEHIIRINAENEWISKSWRKYKCF